MLKLEVLIGSGKAQWDQDDVLDCGGLHGDVMIKKVAGPT
jgi:hypothetical protein